MEKTTVELLPGALRIKNPPASLGDKLRYWRKSLVWDGRTHSRKVNGAFEDLYYRDDSSGDIITMPGFASRVVSACSTAGREVSLSDFRKPMPAYDLEKAAEGLREYQIPLMVKMVMSGGGILSAATGAGKSHIMAAMIRAYDSSELAERGTPQIVMAVPDKDITRKNWELMRELFPDREVGLVMSGVRKESDDIQVITLDSLHLLDPSMCGVFIADEVHTASSACRAAEISRFRDCARWGFSATPTGRFDGGDMVTEGLFGPVVSSFTYEDGVRTGALVPIDVVWVNAPEPDIDMNRYSECSDRDYRIRWGVKRNSGFAGMVSDIMRRTPDSLQSLCFTQWLDQMDFIHQRCPEIPYVHADVSEGRGGLSAIKPSERKKIYGMMASGEIRKIFATYVYKQGVDFPGLDVVVNASGGGSDIVAKQIPGRASRKSDGKDRAWVVDFWHGWDTCGGSRPRRGPLLACDYSRRKAYDDLGFSQQWVDSVDSIPFIKESYGKT